MSPLEYMNQYLKLQVTLDNWEADFASIDMYLNHGIQPRSGVAWKAGDQLIGEMSRETKLPWSSLQFNIEGFPIRPINIRRAFMGKGSPQDLKDALWLAHRYGYIRNPARPRAGALTLKDYCRTYTGLDCNGFVGNYLAQHHNTSIEVYGALANRLTRVEQIQSGTSLVWVPPQGGQYPHIAIVNSAQVVGDTLMWDLVQSSGSLIKGGPANGLRWGDWPKPVTAFKKDHRGHIYLPHGAVWLYPCNHALANSPVP
jgi:hypothetical protein